MNNNKWIVKSQDEECIKKFVNSGFDDITARLLYNRGLINIKDIDHFFDTELSGLNDPMMLNGMDIAVNRIKKAISCHEKVVVYGDYDVDGITSVVLLYSYLLNCGADVSYYIPDRLEEGYGLNKNALININSSGTKLLITVDTGTTAITEIDLANSMGIDVIVTDHHECKQEIPKCVAVINPKRHDSNYSYKDLAGVGVVFKLLCAIDGDSNKIFKLYGSLTAIGTVADIMSLRGENRIIVCNGVKSLAASPCSGMKALLELTGKNKRDQVNAGVIAFQIAPRLNAAGRIGDPSTSVELLLSRDISTARELSQKLCDENHLRQNIEQGIFVDVEKMIQKMNPYDKIIVLGSTKWHHGVIGIVASRIVEKYCKPCILVCFDGQKAKGSARSVKGVNIFELLSLTCSDLEKFGGHEMAAGLTLSTSNFNKFVKDITKEANKRITDKMLIPVIEAEMELDVLHINRNLIDLIKKFEPFGTDNLQPVFFVREMHVRDIYSVGAGRHIKICLEKNNILFQAMYFGCDIARCAVAVHDTVDIMCIPCENVFNGKTSIMLNIKSIRVTGETLNFNIIGETMYKKYLIDGIVDSESRVSRNEIVAFYRYILRQSNAQISKFDTYALARNISYTVNDFNYCKLRFCIDTLAELGIIAYEGTDIISITIADTKTKVDLHKSQTWKRVGNS